MSGAPRAATLPRARLVALLEQMRGRRIVVIGDCMLDRYLIGDADRISPEAPVPVVLVSERRLALGGAANVAANITALGGLATLVGVIGVDRDGEAFSALITASGINGAGLLAVPNRPTTTKTRVKARNQQVVRIDEETDHPLELAPFSQVLAGALEAIATADAVVLEDYNKGLLTPELIGAVMKAARARAVPIVVDPKFHGFFEYSGATVFKPNRRELCSAIPEIDVGSAADLAKAMARLQVAHLLLTLGAEGMMLVSSGGAPPHRIASVAREVFDPAGAGDTVTAWVAAALAAGATAIEAAEIANLAAGVEVSKADVATVSPQEVLEAHG